MRYLFVHQNFPGQYLHLLRHLAADPANEIVFISESSTHTIEGVRRILYNHPKSDQETIHPAARDWDTAARRGDIVGAMSENLKRLGFMPDIIIGHHGWGELLNLADVFPGVPILGYFEFYYHHDGEDVVYDSEFVMSPERFPRIRAMNIINHLALDLNQHGQTPTEWQRNCYPEWARGRIRVIREGARLDVCKPDPSARRRGFEIGDFKVKPGEKLITYVARNLEPYRGFHTMFRSLPELLGNDPDIKVVMVGGNDVSYGAKLATGTWREHYTKELEGKYDVSRVCMPGQISYELYLQMLRRSDVHVYLTYPFVASWSLREALATGCAVVASDVGSVKEFVTHGVNGLLVNGLDAKELAASVQTLLKDKKLNKRLRDGARRYAEQNLNMDDYIRDMMAAIHEITGKT